MFASRSLLPLALLFPLFVVGCGDDEGERPTPRSPSRTDRPEKRAPRPDATPMPVPIDAGTSGDGGPSRDEADREAEAARVRAGRALARARRLAEAEAIDRALTVLRRARQEQPEHGRIRLALARLCLLSSDNECARDEAQAAVDHAGRVAAVRADALELLGQAQQALGNTDAAVDAWTRSIELRPQASIAERLRNLTAPDAGAVETPDEVSCPITAEESQIAVRAVAQRPEARNRQVCPLLASPYVERDPAGASVQTHLVVAFAPHDEAGHLLADHASLGAAGNYALLAVRIVREQAQIVVLDDGRGRDRDEEIIGEISAQVRRITLGPARAGLAIEITTNGWSNVARDETPYAFERHELILLGQHLAQHQRLTQQVTLEQGHEETEDCRFGTTSRPVKRVGTVWLEDLDLSGVPEICQETAVVRTDIPAWMGGGDRRERVEAVCRRWIASELQRSTAPVPTIELDEFDRERSIHQVLEVSRVPAQLRGDVREHLGQEVIIAAKALELTTSGMRALAILASETEVKAMAVTADDDVSFIELGRIGRWREISSEIDDDDPQLLWISVTARGDGLEDAAARRWLYLLRTTPGLPPRVVLTEDLYIEEPFDTQPCPSVTRTTVERETRDETLYLTFDRTRHSGPGSEALEQVRQQRCDRFEQTLEAEPDAGLPDAGPLQTASELCPHQREDLEDVRYVQSPDGRFTETTLL